MHGNGLITIRSVSNYSISSTRKTMHNRKPMLLYQKNPDLDLLSYPVYVTPKLDGIRCLAFQEGALSRTLKPIRNRYVQECFSKAGSTLWGMDGELIVGPPTTPDVYRVTNSGV